MMPEMDGIELAREIRGGARRDLPLVLRHVARAGRGRGEAARTSTPSSPSR